MRSVAAILKADHSELHDLLEAAIAAIGDADLQRSYDATDLFWARLAMHIRAEHLHLFPLLRAAGDAETGRILDELRHDHDMFMTELARAIKALRLAFTFGNKAETLPMVAGLVEKVRERLVTHDEIEENEIYPLVASNTLGEPDLESLVAGIQKELQNYPQRFAG